MRTRAFGCDTIFGVDGEHATPYLTRAWIGRLRLHVFHRGDADPDPHDHPWGFWTFPLTPYVEEVTRENLLAPGTYVTARRLVRAFRWHYRPAAYTHRVLGRFSGWFLDAAEYKLYKTREAIDAFDEPLHDAGRIVTLVWREKGERQWGFLRLRNGRWCWTPWKEYVFGDGKHAPCEPVEAKKARTRVNNAVIGE